MAERREDDFGVFDYTLPPDEINDLFGALALVANCYEASFFDFGCGRGRLFALAARHWKGPQRGIEIQPAELVAEAGPKVDVFRGSFADAAAKSWPKGPPEYTVGYMYAGPMASRANLRQVADHAMARFKRGSLLAIVVPTLDPLEDIEGMEFDDATSPIDPDGPRFTEAQRVMEEAGMVFLGYVHGIKEAGQVDATMQMAVAGVPELVDGTMDLAYELLYTDPQVDGEDSEDEDP